MPDDRVADLRPPVTDEPPPLLSHPLSVSTPIDSHTVESEVGVAVNRDRPVSAAVNFELRNLVSAALIGAKRHIQLVSGR